MGSATVTAGLQLRGRGLGQGLPSQAGLLDGDQHGVHYLRRPYQREPDSGVTSVDYNFA